MDLKNKTTAELELIETELVAKKQMLKNKIFEYRQWLEGNENATDYKARKILKNIMIEDFGKCIVDLLIVRREIEKTSN
jgi:hypothetical protein